MPYDNLVKEYASYPHIELNVKHLNKGAFGLAILVSLSVVANFVASAVFLIGGDEAYNYYYGARTLTALITNTMLLTNKVSAHLSCAARPTIAAPPARGLLVLCSAPFSSSLPALPGTRG